MGETTKQVANIMKPDILNVATITPPSGKAVTQNLDSAENSEEPAVFEGIFKDAVSDVSADLAKNPAENEDADDFPLTAAALPEGQELPLTGEELPVQLAGIMGDASESGKNSDHDLIATSIYGELVDDVYEYIIGDAGATVTPIDEPLDDIALQSSVSPVASVAVPIIPGLVLAAEHVASASAVSQVINQPVKATSLFDSLPTQSQAIGKETGVLPSLTVAMADTSQSGGQAGDFAGAKRNSAMFFSVLKAEAITESVFNDKVSQMGIRDILSPAQPQLLDAVSKSNTAPLKVGTETFQMQQTLDKPGWSQEFTHRLMWMNKQGVQQVRLQMNPANLGNIDIKVIIQNDQANISFLSQHGIVREAIEASLPRLREMMTDAGVKLDNVNVSTQSEQQQHQQASANHTGNDRAPGSAMRIASDENSLITESVLVNLPVTGEKSAVDYYV